MAPQLNVPPPTACKSYKNDERECANCGVCASDILGMSLKACSRCSLVFYCSEPCQRQHWNTGSHKRFCVAVGDRKPPKYLSGVATNNPIGEDTKQIKAGELVGHATEPEECAICLEPFHELINCCLPCGHVFHNRCVLDIESLGQSQKCPLCRSALASSM